MATLPLKNRAGFDFASFLGKMLSVLTYIYFYPWMTLATLHWTNVTLTFGVNGPYGIGQWRVGQLHDSGQWPTSREGTKVIPKLKTEIPRDSHPWWQKANPAVFCWQEKRSMCCKQKMRCKTMFVVPVVVGPCSLSMLWRLDDCSGCTYLVAPCLPVAEFARVQEVSQSWSVHLNTWRRVTAVFLAFQAAMHTLTYWQLGYKVYTPS